MGGSSSSYTGEKKIIAILGGGLAGHHMARTLGQSGSNFDIIVIDKKTYVDWCVASPGVPTDLELARTCIIPQEAAIKSYGSNVTFRRGAIKSLSKNQVHMEDGQSIAFDFAVIALGPYLRFQPSFEPASVAGSGYSNGLWKAGLEQETPEQRMEFLQEFNQSIQVIPMHHSNAGLSCILSCAQAAENIVIVGAGITGCEAAGEIATAYPEKHITLVGNIVQAAKDRYKERLLQALEGLGVKVIQGVRQTGGLSPSEVGGDRPMSSKVREYVSSRLNGGVQSAPGLKVGSDENSQVGKAVLDNGQELPCDLLINCKGVVYHQVDMAPEFGDCKAEDGRIKTNAGMSIDGCEHVFALSDVVAVPTGRTSTWSAQFDYKKQTSTIQQNILDTIAGRPQSAKFEFGVKGGFAQIGIMNLGRNTTVASLGCCCECCDDGIGGFFKNNTKGRYFTWVALKDFGKGNTW